MTGIKWPNKPTSYYVADEVSTPVGKITIWRPKREDYFAECTSPDGAHYTGKTRTTEAKAKSDAQNWYNRRVNAALKQVSAKFFKQ